MPEFRLLAQDVASSARRGVMVTAHGAIETPAFLFCATQGTLKSMDITVLEAHHTQILLANTYHLMLQPGADLVEHMGGLHSFMGWSGPIFTDSGGYQIFSLSHGSVSEEIKGKRRFLGGPLHKVIIREEGALFTSHRDGSRHLLTPERSIQVQCQLGSDLMCVLDECTPLHMSKEETKKSLDLSHRWALASLEAFNRHGSTRQGLYGIVQGGIYPEFRQQSAEFIGSLPFFGHCIGGSLGANKGQMAEVVDMALQALPREKPIHLLGIGGIGDIFSGVKKGIDTFDCVSPTRLGRHGCALITGKYWEDALEVPHSREHINLWRACFKDDPRPIDAHCPCWTCKRYSRAYLHHLLKAKELLALSALTLHNVSFMNRLMEAIRCAITLGNLDEVQASWTAAPAFKYR